jgi:hypothetical protein
MIPVLLFSIYAILVWFVIGEQEAAMQIKERLLQLAAPLSVYPLWWIVRLVRTIPEREERSGRADIL